MQSPNLKGHAAAWAVPLVNEFAALARSVVLARLIGPEELGKTMLLALTLRLVEMASDFSIERMLSQAKDGDTPAFQKAMQGAAVLRGLVLTAALLLLAVPMVLIYPDGPKTASFALLALVPLMRGVIHLDYRRRERGFDYGGLVIVDGGAAVIMLLSAPLFASLIGDHRAFLLIILTQFAAQLVLSHLVAERRYGLSFERLYLSRIWAFGAPMILNSFLMFLTFQADRLIVAGYFSWAELGVYGVALQLALLPAQITGRAAGSLLAPAFRRAIEAGQLASVAMPALKSYGLLALVFALGYGLLAQPLIQLVYGDAFLTGSPLIWALGIAAAIRIARTPISHLAVSLGRTGIPAKANLLRALAIIPALFAAMAGAPLYALALAAIIGEAMAAVRAWILINPYLFSTSQEAKP